MGNILDEKIKIKNQPLKNIIVKKGEYKGLVVRPYLTADDIVSANLICIEQFLSETKEKNVVRFDLFTNVKIVYDLVVVQKCTNLDIEASFEIYDNLVSSGILNFIKGKIINYESTWGVILESLKMRNTFMGLNLIEERIPNTKEFEKNVSQINKVINDLNEKDPQLLRKMVENMTRQTPFSSIL